MIGYGQIMKFLEEFTKNFGLNNLAQKWHKTLVDEYSQNFPASDVIR